MLIVWTVSDELPRRDLPTAGGQKRADELHRREAETSVYWSGARGRVEEEGGGRKEGAWVERQAF